MFLSNDENILYIIILIFLINISEFSNNKIYNYYIENSEKIKLFLSDYFNTSKNQKVICNLSSYFRQNIFSPMIGGNNFFYKKYLKYKYKYIQLKYR